MVFGFNFSSDSNETLKPKNQVYFSLREKRDSQNTNLCQTLSSSKYKMPLFKHCLFHYESTKLYLLLSLASATSSVFSRSRFFSKVIPL